MSFSLTDDGRERKEKKHRDESERRHREEDRKHRDGNEKKPRADTERKHGDEVKKQGDDDRRHRDGEKRQRDDERRYRDENDKEKSRAKLKEPRESEKGSKHRDEVFTNFLSTCTVHGVLLTCLHLVMTMTLQSYFMNMSC